MLWRCCDKMTESSQLCLWKREFKVEVDELIGRQNEGDVRVTVEHAFVGKTVQPSEQPVVLPLRPNATLTNNKNSISWLMCRQRCGPPTLPSRRRHRDTMRIIKVFIVRSRSFHLWKVSCRGGKLVDMNAMRGI